MREGGKVFYNSNEAAQRKTITGWVSRDGRFYGEDEHMARWAGSTHSLCECGNEVLKSRKICDACWSKKQVERYFSKPFMEWDCKALLYSESFDVYFSDRDEIETHCDEHECASGDLRLVVCHPVYASIVDDEFWQDDLPDGLYLDDVAPELSNALKALNDFIIKEKPILCWRPGKFRTSVEVMDERD